VFSKGLQVLNLSFSGERISLSIRHAIFTTVMQVQCSAVFGCCRVHETPGMSLRSFYVSTVGQLYEDAEWIFCHNLQQEVTECRRERQWYFACVPVRITVHSTVQFYLFCHISRTLKRLYRFSCNLQIFTNFKMSMYFKRFFITKWIASRFSII